MMIVYPSAIREFLLKNIYPWQKVVPGQTFILPLKRNVYPKIWSRSETFTPSNGHLGHLGFAACSSGESFPTLWDCLFLYPAWVLWSAL